MTELFKQHKLQTRTFFIAQLVNPDFLRMFPELRELIDNVDLDSIETQEIAYSDFVFFSRLYNGYDMLHISANVSENMPFVKIETTSGNDPLFLQKLANVAAFMIDAHDNEKSILFGEAMKDNPEIRANLTNIDWIRNVTNGFMMLPVHALVDTKLPNFF